MSAIFQPNVLEWLFGSGIGTNIGASIFWGFVAGAAGYWLKGHVARIHARLALLHRSHKELHEKLDRLHEAHQGLYEKLDALAGHAASRK